MERKTLLLVSYDRLIFYSFQCKKQTTLKVTRHKDNSFFLYIQQMEGLYIFNIGTRHYLSELLSLLVQFLDFLFILLCQFFLLVIECFRGLLCHEQGHGDVLKMNKSPLLNVATSKHGLTKTECNTFLSYHNKRKQHTKSELHFFNKYVNSFDNIQVKCFQDLLKMNMLPFTSTTSCLKVNK